MDLSITKKGLNVLAIFIATTISAHAYSNANFAGPYVGVNGGVAWGKSSSHTNTSFVPDSYFTTTDISQINDTGSTKLTLNNFVGGAQLGYNFQYDNVVFGPVIDFDSLAGTSSSTTTTTYLSAPNTTFTMYTKTSTNWLLTLRPILGLASNNLLFYATGGLALAQLKTNNTFNDDFLAGTAAPSNASESASQSQTKTGWVVGAGLKYAVSNNILIGAEYLYTSFGNVKSNGGLNLNPAYTSQFTPPLAEANSFKNRANYTASIIRLGIDYKFS